MKRPRQIRQCDVVCISVRLDGFWKLWVPRERDGWLCGREKGERRDLVSGTVLKTERGSGAWRGVTGWVEQGSDGWKATPENRGVRPPPCPVSGVPIASGRDRYPLPARRGRRPSPVLIFHPRPIPMSDVFIYIYLYLWVWNERLMR